MNDPRHQGSLRHRLDRPDLVKAPGVYDGLTALLVEQAGFEAAFVSGAGIAFARYGSPDMGLVTATEVAATVAAMRERVVLPLLVDMDTGFGNALNVQRTVREFERAGASALQMEDQTFPKRCGHMAGKSVIGADEMVGKIKAAVDARLDDDTFIIARTDALAIHGPEEAMARGEHYLEAGADALFIEAPGTQEQVDAIGRQFGARTPAGLQLSGRRQQPRQHSGRGRGGGLSHCAVSCRPAAPGSPRLAADPRHNRQRGNDEQPAQRDARHQTHERAT